MKKLALLLLLLTVFGCTNYQETLKENTSEIIGRTIVISDFRFNPQTLVVTEGEHITWKNLDKDAHSLFYNSTETDPLEKGETFTIVASEPGTYKYFSGNHPFIQGTIIIRANSSESGQ